MISQIEAIIPAKQERFILTTTLKQLRKAGACCDGYNKVVRSLQNLPFTEKDDDRCSYIRFDHKEEINILDILESNGVDDCLWALCATTQKCDKVARLMAVKFVREVQYLITDPISLNALDVAERFANGEATEEELAAAQSAAWDAAQSAAWTAAWAAAKLAAPHAAFAAAHHAAEDAAHHAAEDAAQSAAWDAAQSAAWTAAWAAAKLAAKLAARAKQAEIIKSFLGR
jgi:hypothetical protein